jgi:hypothetical protein
VLPLTAFEPFTKEDAITLLKSTIPTIRFVAKGGPHSFPGIGERKLVLNLVESFRKANFSEEELSEIRKSAGINDFEWAVFLQYPSDLISMLYKKEQFTELENWLKARREATN